MPSVTITSGKTGKKYDVDFQHPPSEADIDEATAHLDGGAPAAQQRPPEPKPEGFFQTAGREFASKIVPAAATAAGGVVGGAGAGLLGLETGPGAIATGIAGDIAAGTAAGAGAESLQRSVMGPEWSDQNMAQMEANAKAHPFASTLGGVLPFILSSLGGGGAIKATAKKAVEAATEKAGAEGLTEEALKRATQKAAASAGRPFNALESASGFGRASGAAEAERKAEGQEGDIAGGIGTGLVSGAGMSLIPHADLHDAAAWSDVIKKALWNVTGKAAGDATVMVATQKAYDSLVNGKPFSMRDVIGELGGSAVDFSLLNAISAGWTKRKLIAAKMFRTAESFEKNVANRYRVPQQHEAVPLEEKTEEQPGGEPGTESEPPAGEDRLQPEPAAPHSATDPLIVGATYTPEGYEGGTFVGKNHKEAFDTAKATDPMPMEGREFPEERHEREGGEWGFMVQHGDGSTQVVDRETALELAKQNGQLNRDAQIERGKLHSDQLQMADEADWRKVPVKNSNQRAFTDETEARAAFEDKDGRDPENAGVKDLGKPESFREWTMRMVCRGFSV